MNLPKYPDYRDSGVDWLGAVPSDWEVARLKAKVSLVTEKAKHRTRPVALENVESWSGRFLPTGGEFEGDGVAFCQGDLLFGKLRPYLAKVYLADEPGEAVGDFHVIRAVRDLEPRFLQYQILNRSFIDVVDGTTFGSKMPRASWEALAGMPVVVPSIAEQCAISAFLDHETQKTDALIAEQERLLSLLAEKRQAVISNAVTKGLNPNAPMKDSGVQWLGEVPAHWQVLPIKAIGLLRGGAGFPDDEQGLDNEELGFYKVASLGKADSFGRLPDAEHTISRETADRLRAFIFPKGTVVFAKVGAALMLGRFGSLSRDACIDNNMMGFITAKENEPDFLRYSMHLIKFDLIVNPGAVPSVNGSQIGGYLLPLPSREEQIEIVEFIESETSKLDALRDQAVSAIELLRERRATLISAAVTGQVDVRRIA